MLLVKPKQLGGVMWASGDTKKTECVTYTTAISQQLYFTKT